MKIVHLPSALNSIYFCIWIVLFARISNSLYISVVAWQWDIPEYFQFYCCFFSVVLTWDLSVALESLFFFLVYHLLWAWGLVFWNSSEMYNKYKHTFTYTYMYETNTKVNAYQRWITLKNLLGSHSSATIPTIRNGRFVDCYRSIY